MKNTKNKLPANEDMHDSPKDRERMQSESSTLNLPEVKDIPGQEHIRPPELKEFADSTISSKDEEGQDILGTGERLTDNHSDISPDEEELLQRTENSMGSDDDVALERAKLDNMDEDGEPLNEQIDISGKDLDVPGAEEDDANEEIGEEDEENNSYSLKDDREERDII